MYISCTRYILNQSTRQGIAKQLRPKTAAASGGIQTHNVLRTSLARHHRIHGSRGWKEGREGGREFKEGRKEGGKEGGRREGVREEGRGRGEDLDQW